jgi:thioredoxin 1
VVKVDVDANPKTASQMQVRAMPTLLVIKNGAVVGQLVGRQPKDKIKAIIDPALTA